MKRILAVLLMLLLFAPCSYGADTPVSGMTEATSPNTNADLLYMVVNGASRKISMANFLKLYAITKTATGDLSAAEVSGTQINNYNQADDMVLTLPTAAGGYNFLFMVSTTVAKYIAIKAGTNDKIYLAGAPGTDNQCVQHGSSTAAGASFVCFTFQTGSSAYDWICKAGAGTWTAGACP